MIVQGIRGRERLSEEQFLARPKAIYQIIRQSKTPEVALETVGEGLQFDRRFSDERGWPIKPMIAVPIKDEVMLGVLQLINFEGDPSFDSSDLKRAGLASQMLARQFRESLQSNGGPFDQLGKQESLSSRELAEAHANASLRGASVSSVLMETIASQHRL